MTPEEKRLELHALLVRLLGSSNVYHQPPENLALRFPAIIYERVDYAVEYADDRPYHSVRQWQVSVVSQEPTHPVVDKFMELLTAVFKTRYVVSGMQHDVVTIYY